MKAKLTKRVVEAMKPAERDAIVWDTELKGFGVKVTPQGRKAYFVYYRTKAGLQRRPAIGEHGRHGLTCERAREIAGRWIASVKGGGDPSAERKADTARTRASRAPENSVGAWLDDFDKKHIATRRPRSQEEMRRHAACVRAAWGARPIAEITKRDVIGFIDGCGMTINANRRLALVKTFLRWCSKRDAIPYSPAMDVDKPVAEVTRDRVLTPDEIRAVWTACEALPEPFTVFGPMVRFLLLSGQRKTPVRFLRWADVDEAEKVWHIPGEYQKSGRSHEVPLSDAALAIVRDQRRKLDEAQAKSEAETDRPLVFATAAGAAFNVYSAAKLKLDAVILAERREAAKGAGEDPDKVKALAPWRLHDLRRTCAAGMASLGISRTVIGKVLDHAEAGVTAIYDRHGYGAEKCKALEDWAKRIEAILATAPGKIVELKRAI
ncbi:MAG: site-specific integrase [Alphaproteobacteria bacterium]